jgi:arylsulfatase A-like enzyme
MVYARGEPVDVSGEDLQYLVDAYDDEIAYFDTQFARLIEELDRRGLSGNTMIVVASDHGEEFLQEHGHVKHCRALYDASTATPLVLRIPGVIREQPITVPVENIDIAPTILDYLGIDTSGFGFEGSSLRPVIEGGGKLREHRFSLQGAQRSVDDGERKLIVKLTTGDRQLYDLASDPGERTNLLDPEDGAADPLDAALAQWRKWVERGVRHEESVRVSEEAQERLKALGYLE